MKDIKEIAEELYGASIILGDEYGEYICSLCRTFQLSSVAGASSEFMKALEEEMREQKEYIDSDFVTVEEEVVRSYTVKRLKNIYEE